MRLPLLLLRLLLLQLLLLLLLFLRLLRPVLLRWRDEVWRRSSTLTTRKDHVWHRVRLLRIMPCSAWGRRKSLATPGRRKHALCNSDAVGSLLVLRLPGPVVVPLIAPRIPLAPRISIVVISVAPRISMVVLGFALRILLVVISVAPPIFLVMISLAAPRIARVVVTPTSRVAEIVLVRRPPPGPLHIPSGLLIIITSTRLPAPSRVGPTRRSLLPVIVAPSLLAVAPAAVVAPLLFGIAPIPSFSTIVVIVRLLPLVRGRVVRGVRARGRG
mmetsp:Transcript_121312/g.387689  ORF Transcript_121312/g.387689 Transcript_121312/m.387689 type:complete len:272 (+) Transcript_121312:36-851(+)